MTHPYKITIRQIESDGATLYEARIRELPNAVDYGETREEAYGLAVDTIETTAQVFAEQGRQMPPALQTGTS
jgi:predicted RNase H-like HicB family nuclease